MKQVKANPSPHQRRRRQSQSHEDKAEDHQETSQRGEEGGNMSKVAKEEKRRSGEMDSTKKVSTTRPDLSTSSTDARPRPSNELGCGLKELTKDGESPGHKPIEERNAQSPSKPNGVYVCVCGP